MLQAKKTTIHLFRDGEEYEYDRKLELTVNNGILEEYQCRELISMFVSIGIPCGLSVTTNVFDIEIPEDVEEQATVKLAIAKEELSKANSRNYDQSLKIKELDAEVKTLRSVCPEAHVQIDA